LWDIGTSKVLTKLAHQDSVWSVAFSPDGKTLASGSRDSTIKLWDIGTSKVLTTLSAHRGEVSSVAFSPDGKTLASGSWDSTIRLWNLDLDDLLAKGCEHLEEYLASREELREELCPQE
jgi:WD40 repeat protein